MKKNWPVWVLVLLSVCVYSWAVGYDFVYYDDHSNIFENQPLLNFNLEFFWKYAYEGLYIPVVYTLWMAVLKIFGLQAGAFHALVIIFHTLNAFLVFKIIKKFKFSVEAGFFGAVLFLIHPLQVESVVWASGFKDVSFGFFCLSAALLFNNDAKTRLSRTGTLILIVCAVLCKPTAVVLPFVLIAATFLNLRDAFVQKIKLTLKETWFLLPALALGLYSIALTKSQQPVDTQYKVAVSFGERILIVLDSLGFYLVKTLFPTRLYVDYARIPRLILAQHSYIYYVIAAAALLSVLIFTVYLNSKNKIQSEVFNFSVLWAFAFFLPTSGLVTFGHQMISTVADRYMYMVLVAVSLGGAYVYDVLQKRTDRKTYKAVAVILVLVFSFTSYVQSLNWKNQVVFSEFFYEANPNNYFANKNMGLLYQHKGEDENALKYFNRAREIDPYQFSALAGIISVYFNARQYDKMDSFIASHMSFEQIGELRKTPLELFSFLKAVTESYIERQKYLEAFHYLCRAQALDLQRYKAELEADLNLARSKIPEDQRNCPSF